MGEPISRRALVGGVAGAAVVVAVGGATKALAGENTLLRPPGAQDEAHFLATCLRCNRCESICPQSCLRTAVMEDGVINWRTPVIDFHRGICDFCGKCETVCPSGAVTGVSETASVIGLAVVDQDRCIAFQQSGCQVCVDACTYGAITLDGNSHPVVDASVCNGCGRCENKCPSASYLAYTGGKLRGINVVVKEA